MQKNAKSLLEKVYNQLRKHFGTSATILKQETCLKIKTKVLVDSDIQLLHELEGMYANAMIKRSDLGLVTIINFS